MAHATGHSTLSDIARETHTSVSTVSRVLAGGNGAARISSATRDKVLQAAMKLGYKPNLVARSLRTRKHYTVALVVSDLANPVAAQVASLIEQRLHRHGYWVMLCNSGEDPKRELEYLNMLPAKGIDGLILVPLLRSKKALAEHLPKDLPFVLLDRPIPGVPRSVSNDEDQTANMLCDALGRLGVQNAALVSGPRDVVTHRRRAEIVSKRLHVVARHEGPAQKETGRVAFIRFMEITPQPDAIVCTNNSLGQGVIDGIDQIESPPVIACFGELPMMHLLPIPIVCSLHDVTRLADECVTQLLAQLQAQNENANPHPSHDGNADPHAGEADHGDNNGDHGRIHTASDGQSAPLSDGHPHTAQDGDGQPHATSVATCETTAPDPDPAAHPDALPPQPPPRPEPQPITIPTRVVANRRFTECLMERQSQQRAGVAPSKPQC